MIQNLGTVLSKDQMKHLKEGDNESLDNKCNVKCTANSDCDTTCSSCEKGEWGDQKFCFKS
jgi:hypothetical protein